MGPVPDFIPASFPNLPVPCEQELKSLISCFSLQQVWDKLLSGDVNLLMAVPTVYAKLIEYYEKEFEHQNKESRDRIKDVCSTKIR